MLTRVVQSSGSGRILLHGRMLEPSGVGKEEVFELLLVHRVILAGQALFQSGGNDGEAGPVQGFGDRRQLGYDILAFAPLLDHSGDGRELALGALESVDDGGKFVDVELHNFSWWSLMLPS